MNELKLIEDLLIELGHNVSKETINGFNMLTLKGEGSKNKLESLISITLYPVDNNDIKTRLIQFYFEFKPNSKYSTKSINDILFKKMKEVPYGNFNYHKDSIYYKYVLVCKENTIEKEIIYDIINVLYYTIDVVIDEIIN